MIGFTRKLKEEIETCNSLLRESREYIEYLEEEKRILNERISVLSRVAQTALALANNVKFLGSRVDPTRNIRIYEVEASLRDEVKDALATLAKEFDEVSK